MSRITSRRIGLRIAAALVLAASFTSLELGAQAATAVEDPEAKILSVRKKAAERANEAEAFFNSLQPLELTLTTNIRRIRGDKQDKAPWRPATISYTGPDGKSVVIPAEIRTRGLWRLKNCEFPPLRINFTSEATKGTLLQGLDKPKLVNYCRDNDEFEQYIIQEMQLYRVYSLLTPASHRARLLTMTYTDSATGKVHARRSAIILEEPESMAARLGGPLVEQEGATADHLEPKQGALVGLFHYFIGNTDFSTFYLHNVELVGQPNGVVLPVAYDFDFAGAINAQYASVDPKLSVRRVRDRLFRGYCHSPEDYASAFEVFKQKKDAIFALYADTVGKMLKPKVAEETLRYYEDFYRTINDPRRAKRDIVDSCLKTG